jgi:hypothetical protein
MLSAILSAAAVSAADAKPNFTGVWKHSEDASSTIYGIGQQDPNVTISCKSEFHVGSIGSFLSGATTYIVDGIERESKIPSGRESWTSANWQGSALVILRITKDGYRVSVTRESWMLSQDGRTLSKTTRTINMDGVTENTESFLKQD